MADTPIEGLRRTWEAAAPGWAKWEPIWVQTLTHATEAMLDAAGVQPGMQVLDVACGAGSQTLRAASRVGPSGQVTATDISRTMLDHVRRTAIEAGLTNVDTAEGAAEELDLPAASFDAAICRLGVMLFADPAGAVRSVRAALKPVGRFAALVFTTPSNNPFMVTPMTVLLRHANAEPPAAGQPGLFALGGDGVLRGLLSDCGFADVTISTVTAPIRFATLDDAVSMFQEAAGAYRAVVAHLSEMERAAAWDEVRERLTEFESDGGVEAELEFIIGSGARP